MDRLQISSDGRFLARSDGSKFPFLADTAWTLPARLKWDDAEYYMKRRKEQGFTVLQMVVLDPEHNPDMRSPQGIPALRDGDLLQPNEAYFSYVDFILDMAEELGFYVLLLPAWGQLVTGDDWGGGHFPKTVTEENARPYGEWIGRRYKDRKNILWCLGGDRMPVHKGVDYRPVWRAMAEGIAYGVTGEHLSYDKDPEKWKKLLMTYHACHEKETGKCSSFSGFPENEAWISFCMLQSGHGNQVKNYEYVAEEYGKSRVMPVWDGEPAYEAMPNEWPITDRTVFSGPDVVRKRSCFSLLQGAFGYTYGHSCTWCMISEKDKNRISKVTWFEALSSEGSDQIRYLRAFMDQYLDGNVIPCQKILSLQNEQGDELQTHRQAAYLPEKKTAVVYFSSKAGEVLDLSAESWVEDLSSDGRTVYGRWLDLEDGSMTKTEVLEGKDGRFSVSNEKQKDRILLLSGTPDLPDLVVQEAENIQAAEEKKVFDW